jgi:hypothetical protein
MRGIHIRRGKALRKQARAARRQIRRQNRNHRRMNPGFLRRAGMKARRWNLLRNRKASGRALERRPFGPELPPEIARERRQARISGLKPSAMGRRWQNAWNERMRREKRTEAAEPPKMPNMKPVPRMPDPRTEPAPGPRLAAPQVRRSRPAPAAPSGGNMSGRSRIEAAVEVLKDAIGSYHPESGDDLDGFIGGLSEIPRAAGEAVRRSAESWHDEHIHEGAIQAVQEFGGVMSGTADAADDAVNTHRQRHGFWLNRS